MNNSLLFKAGRGFYEFTKPEIISHKKEVVLIEKETGDMFTGKFFSFAILGKKFKKSKKINFRKTLGREACDLIGAGGAGRIKPAALKKWRVFVQVIFVRSSYFCIN